jgi:hypothetical protein
LFVAVHSFKEEDALMSKVTVFDNEYGTIWHHPEHNIVHHRFKQFCHHETFREFITRAADLFVEKGCVKWLSDDRENFAFHPDDREWGVTDWTPRVAAAGWKYWALIMPAKAAGQMSMQPLVDEYSEMGVEVRLFTDPDEALAWLESV